MSQKGESSEFLKPPFTAYDFFGYLIPSVVFFACVYLFESSAKTFVPTHHQPLHSVLERTLPSEHSSGLVQALAAIGFIIAGYVCGHVIGTISSMLLDRTLVSKAHGYPTESLLLIINKSKSRVARELFYRGLFSWCNLLMWLFLIFAIFNFGYLSFVTGALLGALAFIPTTLYLVVSAIYPHPEVQTGEAIIQRGRTIVENSKPVVLLGLRIFAAPYNLCWWLANRFFKWEEPFNTEFRTHYEAAFNRVFKMDCQNAKTDNYWFTTFFVAERSPEIYQMIRNWFHLYSFARNVATAFYLAFLYGAAYIAFTRASGATFSAQARHCFSGTLGVYFAFSVVLAIRYHYLYYSYYSKNLFRAFIYLNIVPRPDSTKPGANFD